MTRVNNLRNLVHPDKPPDISVERVAKLPVPLLVIGLGGTGAAIVNTIKSTFAERFELPVDENGQSIPIPEHTAYLAIDTDASAQGALDNSEFVNISVPGLWNILNPSKRDTYLSDSEKEWVNRRLDYAYSGMGTGTYRQAARFMLSRNYPMVSAAIKGALTKIRTVEHDSAAKLGRIEIVICTGICGGTGSGTFLDVPQIVHHIMTTEPNLAGRNYKITGYIVMPDVSLYPLAGNPLACMLRMNGYAALKELDFWMNVCKHRTPYTMEFSDKTRVSWTRPPYKDCVLISGRSVSGRMSDNPARAVQITIAENLLHLLANELPHKDAYDRNIDSYLDYEENLKTAVVWMPKRLPVNYGYRAIGTYSKRIPKQKMLYFEGILLLDSFLPMRDQFGRIVPNDALIKDGQTVQRAQEIIGNVELLHIKFAKEVVLPTFCNTTVADKPRIEAMRQMYLRPHDQENIKLNLWIDSIVKPAAGKSAENYLEGAWKRFEDFCEKVLGNPEFGPFSLRDYLEHPDTGLIKELIAQVENWVSIATKFKYELSDQKNACVYAWPDFEHPPILGRTKAINTYLTYLNRYYSGLRRTTFMDAYARAAQKLLWRVREYLAESLKPLCDDVERLYDTLTNIPADDPTLGSDVLDIEALKPRIEEHFSSSNVNNRITQNFLRALCLESLKTTPNRDSYTSDVTFLYRQTGYENVLTVMKNTLSQCFGGMNNQSLDALMKQAAGPDLDDQQEFMTEIAQSVMAGAQPLFVRDAAADREAKAVYSYLSVPDNASEHIHYFNDILAAENVLIKESSLRDRVNCLTSWDGLPMYRYSMMRELRRAYAQALQDPRVSMGVHLVWNGDLDADYTHNWTRLPEPCPFFFFSSYGDAAEERIWQEQCDLTARAIRCGMLKVDASHIEPAFFLHVFWNDALHGTPVPAKTLMDQVSGILAQEIDPATGTVLTHEQKLAMLEALKAQAAKITLEPGRSSECMATYLGLVGQDINPWDHDIAVDPIRRAKAKKNHQKLSEVMAAAILSMNPRLLLVVKNQIEVFEALAKAMGDFDDVKKIWESRIAYAETYAKMMYHNQLRFSSAGATFIGDMNAPTPVIQDALVKDDLKDQSVFTKVGAYLADLPATNQVRRLLEHQMQIKENEYKQKVFNNLLTKEECESGIAMCDRMKGMVENELHRKKADLTQSGADIDTLDKCITMLAGVIAFLDERKAQLEWAASLI